MGCLKIAIMTLPYNTFGGIARPRWQSAVYCVFGN